MTETMRAYIAGFFDGEGSCYVTKRVRKVAPQYYLGISISNTKLDVLKQLREEIGYGMLTVQRHNNGKWKDSGQLVFTSRGDVAKFIDLIYPFVIIKRNHLDVALKFLETRHNGHGQRLKYADGDIRDWCWRMLKHYNWRGPVPGTNSGKEVLASA